MDPKGYPVIVCQEKWAFNNVLCMNMCTRASVYVLTYASIQRRYELGPAGLWGAKGLWSIKKVKYKQRGLIHALPNGTLQLRYPAYQGIVTSPAAS